MSASNRKNPQESRLSVRCIVSDRWLSFPVEAGPQLECGEPFVVRVMTRSVYDKPRRICKLIVTREDLLNTLKQITKAAN